MLVTSRSFAEYAAMFDLDGCELDGLVVDCCAAPQASWPSWPLGVAQAWRSIRRSHGPARPRGYRLESHSPRQPDRRDTRRSVRLALVRHARAPERATRPGGGAVHRRHHQPPARVPGRAAALATHPGPGGTARALLPPSVHLVGRA